MNKAFEKILERLEKYENNDLIEHDSELCEHCKRIDCGIGMDCSICVMDKAQEIVQEVAREYNNGWIPCSERLPELKTKSFGKQVTKIILSIGKKIIMEMILKSLHGCHFQSHTRKMIERTGETQ